MLSPYGWSRPLAPPLRRGGGWCGRVDRIVDKNGIAHRLVAPRPSRRFGDSTRGETKRPPRRSSKWLNSNRTGEGRASDFLSPPHETAAANAPDEFSAASSFFTP